MKIYRIGMYENPTTERLMAMKSVAFAHFSAVGTWSDGEICDACTADTSHRIPPLLMKWEPSTDAIGDFSWDGPFGSVFAVKEHVGQFLRAKRFECQFLPVNYVRPKRNGRWKCVPFPYRGPRLLWGRCETFVDLDMEASNVTVKKCCPVCGSVRYTFTLHNIVIPHRNWHGEKMFRITTNGNSLTTFVTDEGRDVIQSAGFSNIAFSEAGEIVDE
jgi:hypothetical protein